MNLRRRQTAGWPGLVGGLAGMALPWFAPPACLAQAAGAEPGGLAAHVDNLLVAAGVLLVLLVGLLIWEFLDRRAGVAAEPAQAAPAASSEAPVEPAAEEEEDPFRALLKKASASDKEAQSAKAEPPSTRGDIMSSGLSTDESSGPSDTPAAYAAPPDRQIRDLDEEELSPFQRLAQIGSDDRGASAAPLPEPGGRASRIELPGGGSGEKVGGDWAALLNKVQTEETQGAGGPAQPPKPAEEDPWKKLLGQAGPESASAPTANMAAPAATGSAGPTEEADPWKALLSKASSEVAAPPVNPPAIKLGSTEPPPTVEPPRPRSISLDLNVNREEGRTISPPPQTEDE